MTGIENESNDVSVNVNDPEGCQVNDVEVTSSNDVKEIVFRPDKSGKYTVHVKLKDLHVRGMDGFILQRALS